MAKMYLKAMVSELKLKSPNNQVIPSNGRMTAEALTPALTLSICVLFVMHTVPIILRITKMNTTIFICMIERTTLWSVNHITPKPDKYDVAISIPVPKWLEHPAEGRTSDRCTEGLDFFLA